MFAGITRLQQWKSEYTPETCQDKLLYDAAAGLFAVADGASTSSFPHLWADVLVKHFISVPLMGDDPFEVDWWVRLAQKRYTDAMPKLELLSSIAREKEDTQGSESTLVTVRLSRVDETSAQAELLVFGDSCVLIGRPDTRQVALTFPLEQAADFDRRPVCVPSHPGVFNRQFHRCKLLSSVPLAAGNVVLLATDAVARWIISKGGGQYQEIWDSFQAVAQRTPGADWRAFILDQRQNNTIADDDSTALILELQEGMLVPPAEGHNPAGEVRLLGSTTTHSDEVIKGRENSFRQARSDQNRELEAIYYGDGNDLQSRLSGEVTKEQIDHAREVSKALRALISATAANYKKPDFASKMRSIWEQYKDVLQDEPCAEGIRNTLKSNGVIDPPTVAPAPLGNSAPASSSQLGPRAYPSSEPPLPAEAARQDATIKRFHTVLREGGSPTEVVNAHRAFLLLPNAQITSDEQAQVELASKFLAAFFQHDEEALASAYARLEQSPHPTFLKFTPEQSQQLAKAMQHSASLGTLQAALQSHRLEEIATAYQRLQQVGLPLSLDPQEMTQGQLALRLMDALARDTEAALSAAYQELTQAGQEHFFTLNPAQQARLEQTLEEATHPMDPYTVLVTVNGECITAGYLKQVKSLKRHYLPLCIEEYKQRKVTHPPNESTLQKWIERWQAELSDWNALGEATLEELIDDELIKQEIDQAQIHGGDLKNIDLTHDVEKVHQAITTALGKERYAQVRQELGLTQDQAWHILATFVRRRKFGAYLSGKHLSVDLSTWLRQHAQILRKDEAAPQVKQKTRKFFGGRSS